MLTLEQRCAAVRQMRHQSVEAIEVIQRVSYLTGVACADILHTSQHSARATAARHVAMYECRAGGMTFAAISEAFGRDRSTVIHAVRKETARREGRP